MVDGSSLYRFTRTKSSGPPKLHTTQNCESITNQLDGKNMIEVDPEAYPDWYPKCKHCFEENGGGE